MKRKRTALQTILGPISTLLTGLIGGGYNATDPRRKLINGASLYPNKASANTLLTGSLSGLRSYCRHLERNNPSARAGIEALVGLVVGTGIALEPTTGDEAKDAKIRAMFGEWMNTVCVDGSDIYRVQGLGMREMVTAGEAVWRLVPGSGPIPLRLLPLESEWLSETQAAAPSDGCTIVAGIELDRYGQPVAYFIAPPEIGAPEKVPAASIVHVFEKRRALQARGEPWLSPCIETLMNERDLVDAELKAAVTTASLGIAVESEAHPDPDTTEYGSGTDPVQSLALGSVVRLYPGEKVNAFHHTRPSQQIAPFRQMLRGDLAAALRIPQRYLDRDVSRANYSSMRADMLDTDRLLNPVREMVGHQTIGRLYAVAAPFMTAALGFVVDPTKYRLLPDAQPYVDPVKDIAGAVAAITAGLSTHEAEISKRGGDVRQVWTQLKTEQDLAKSLGIKIDLSGTNAPAPQSSIGEVAPPPKADEDEDDASEQPEKGDDMSPDDRARMERMERMIEGMAFARAAQPAPAIPTQAPSVTVEQRFSIDEAGARTMGEAIARSIPAAVVNVAPATVTLPAPVITVEAARMEAPIVNVQVPQQSAPIVNVAAPSVTVQNEVIVPQRTVKATPQKDGSVLMVPQE
jgi:lambda family phage portal protein